VRALFPVAVIIAANEYLQMARASTEGGAWPRCLPACAIPGGPIRTTECRCCWGLHSLLGGADHRRPWGLAPRAAGDRVALPTRRARAVSASRSPPPSMAQAAQLVGAMLSTVLVLALGPRPCPECDARPPVLAASFGRWRGYGRRCSPW